MNSNHYGVFDTLSLVELLGVLLDDVSESEIQLFAYFSSLLWLYKGNSISSWNYRFIKNDLGAPFSEAIHKSIKTMSNFNEYMEKQKNFFRITDGGMEKLSFMRELNCYKKRDEYLRTSVNCMKFSSYVLSKEAIFNEPYLKYSMESNQKRFLLDEESEIIAILYNYFDMLHLSIKDNTQDLLITALTFIATLRKIHRDE